MNCAQHTEIAATAFCRECGKPMCPECQHPALGSVYCDVHAPSESTISDPPAANADTPPAASPSAPPYEAPPSTPYAALPAPPSYTAPAPSPYTTPLAPPYAGQTAPDEGVHPVLALLLGLIPGVGAIYNGQYAKGLVHAVVFGLLVSAIADSHNDGMAALLGIMIGAWEFYMAFEAYHTARKRRYGVTVEEFGSQFDFRGGRGSFPAGALLLIGLGFILLLDTTDIISIDDFGKYWPIGLILLGIYLLYTRLTPDRRADHPRNDAEARR